MANQRPDNRLYDVRLRTRLLAAEIINKEGVDKFLSNLPDAEENAVVSEVRLEHKTGPDL